MDRFLKRTTVTTGKEKIRKNTIENEIVLLSLAGAREYYIYSNFDFGR